MAKIKPEKLFVRRFEVAGSGTFPFDMLRYDRAYPATQYDSSKMDGAAAPAYRTVRLEMVSGVDRGPTDARWESFCWKVLRVLEGEI